MGWSAGPMSMPCSVAGTMRKVRSPGWSGEAVDLPRRSARSDSCLPVKRSSLPCSTAMTLDLLRRWWKACQLQVVTPLRTPQPGEVVGAGFWARGVAQIAASRRMVGSARRSD